MDPLGIKKKKKRDGGEGRRGGGTGGLQYARVVGAEDGGAAHDFVGDADVPRSCGVDGDVDEEEATPAATGRGGMLAAEDDGEVAAA